MAVVDSGGRFRVGSGYGSGCLPLDTLVL